VFENLNDVARCLTRDMNWVLSLDRSHDYYLPFRSTEPAERPTRATAFTYSSILVSRLRQWLTKFDILLVPLLTTMSSKELRAAIVLKMYHMSGMILVTVCQSSNEMAYDLCNDEFEKILQLSESLIVAQTKDSVDYTPFPCEMELLCALSVTARKCRHPDIRRKALALMKHAPPREGPWDCKDVRKLLIDFTD